MDTKGILTGILSETGQNTREFSDTIGYSLTKLYDIQRGKTKRLSDELINLVLEKYPNFNKVWLLTGEGDMLIQDIPSIDAHSNTPTSNTGGVSLTKKERLDALIDYYSEGKPTAFAKLIGVAPSTISSWLARDTYDHELLFAKCKDISPLWLLSGEGNMLTSAADMSSIQQNITPLDQATRPNVEALYGGHESTTNLKRLPLVTQTAAAGFGNSNFHILDKDVKDYYVVPKFRCHQVDFMIELSGSSMYPKYNSGDIVACTILHDRAFIQWNKCHIIATREQGLLCKRLMPGETPDTLKMVSDNENYPPFEVPKNDITGIALVVGVIRLE